MWMNKNGMGNWSRIWWKHFVFFKHNFLHYLSTYRNIKSWNNFWDLPSIRSTVMKHVSVKILPVLNGAVTREARRPRASRRTGGKLIMWKMRAWKASVGVGMGADEGCPPHAHRSWPDWEQDQRRGPPFCLPASPLPTRHSHNSIFHPVYLTPTPQGQPVVPPAFSYPH